ncbi:hypothetical protein A6M13_12775 [Caryophanon tenue]|uniref:Uncharacterized protein n=1 Tax=Caryophanon tenue TaxID=33978 RepID=A0A1C0YHP3_9BACL|nr:hypothetical protein A6M13_12775 [Caryophanon tenue]
MTRLFYSKFLKILNLLLYFFIYLFKFLKIGLNKKIHPLEHIYRTAEEQLEFLHPIDDGNHRANFI